VIFTNASQLDLRVPVRACERILHEVGTYTKRTAMRSFDLRWDWRDVAKNSLQVSGVEAEVSFSLFYLHGDSMEANTGWS
jgi:hypothetical protein